MDVIDYSLSMKGEREKLMRKELTKSVSGLSGGVNYQMIYFSGLAWVAGSELPGYNHSKMKATVKGKGGHKYEWTGKGLYHWTPKGKRQPVEWLSVTSGNIAQNHQGDEIVRKDGLGKPVDHGHRDGAAPTAHFLHDRWRYRRARHDGAH